MPQRVYKPTAFVSSGRIQNRTYHALKKHRYRCHPVFLKRAYPVLLVLIFFAQGMNAFGQAFRFRFDDAPLFEAVEEFKRQTNVDVVYSPELIRELQST